MLKNYCGQTMKGLWQKSSTKKPSQIAFLATIKWDIRERVMSWKEHSTAMHSRQWMTDQIGMMTAKNVAADMAKNVAADMAKNVAAAMAKNVAADMAKNVAAGMAMRKK